MTAPCCPVPPAERRRCRQCDHERSVGNQRHARACAHMRSKLAVGSKIASRGMCVRVSVCACTQCVCACVCENTRTCGGQPAGAFAGGARGGPGPPGGPPARTAAAHTVAARGAAGAGGAGAVPDPTTAAGGVRPQRQRVAVLAAGHRGVGPPCLPRHAASHTSWVDGWAGAEQGWRIHVTISRRRQSTLDKGSLPVTGSQPHALQPRTPTGSHGHPRIHIRAHEAADS